MNYKVSAWLVGLGMALILFPGFNFLGFVLLALGVGNGVGRAGAELGSGSTYKELR